MICRRRRRQKSSIKNILIVVCILGQHWRYISYFVIVVVGNKD